MNPWVVRPHPFRAMPEAELRDLCIVCGQPRRSLIKPTVHDDPAPAEEAQK